MYLLFACIASGFAIIQMIFPFVMFVVFCSSFIAMIPDFSLPCTHAMMTVVGHGSFHCVIVIIGFFMMCSCYLLKVPLVLFVAYLHIHISLQNPFS